MDNQNQHFDGLLLVIALQMYSIGGELSLMEVKRRQAMKQCGIKTRKGAMELSQRLLRHISRKPKK